MSIACTHPMTGAPVKRAARADSAASSDKLLIQRIANGDQAALRTLVDRHQSRVFRFAMRFVNDRSLAEDVVSETFFVAWQQAAGFENRSAVGTWLLAIARYKALSARARFGAADEALDETTAATLVDPKPQPDALVERGDLAVFMRRCLDALPAEQAMLIDLVYFREKSIKDVAIIAGIPLNTVKSRMFLARKKLAAMISAAGMEGAAGCLMPNAV
jgi:RNA polymerase sigma-70 factor (ECF subfamily)